MLIVEDGSCPDGANSYVTLKQADAYLVQRGLWPPSPGDAPIPDDGGEGDDFGFDPLSEDASHRNAEVVVLSDGEAQESEAEEIEAEEGAEGGVEESDAGEGSEEEGEAEGESGVDDSAATLIAAKEHALIRAFDYLNGPMDWLGAKVDWQRVPAWPRLNVPLPGTDERMGQHIPSDMVPQPVIQAQMELAALIYAGRDIMAPVERGGAVRSKSDSASRGVDVLSTSESHSVTYADSAPAEDWLPAVYPLLKPFLASIPGRNGRFQVVKVLRG